MKSLIIVAVLLTFSSCNHPQDPLYKFTENLDWDSVCRIYNKYPDADIIIVKRNAVILRKADGYEFAGESVSWANQCDKDSLRAASRKAKEFADSVVFRSHSWELRP